jgi:hypothetical protein
VESSNTTKPTKEADFMEQLLIELFCDIDDFCKAFEEYWHKHLLTDGTPVMPKCAMSLAEVMTIVVFFHLSNHRTFKWYYKNYICENLKEYFPRRLSYNRFVEVMQSAVVPLTVYLMKHRVGKCSGINFLDSTTLKVCHNRRIYSHRVFQRAAKRGKSSTGWFYGFKLHLIVNDRGEILSFCLTPGNVDDRDWNVLSRLTREIYGKLFADRGYLSQKLFEKLFERNITLVTKLKKNMKNRLMDLWDKVLLRKRAIIESVNDFLKNICQIEHTRHRSPVNFLVNLLSGLTAYSFLPSKPSLRLGNTASLAG